MIIRINIRQLGKKRPAISAVPFELPEGIASVRALIQAVVHESVKAYNSRVRLGEGGIRPMEEGGLSDMERIGKLAFQVNYSEKEADEAAALATALQGFSDGLYRIFHGQKELQALDEPLCLSGQDELTFIRLTMLSGSIF